MCWNNNNNGTTEGTTEMKEKNQRGPKAERPAKRTLVAYMEHGCIVMKRGVEAREKKSIMICVEKRHSQRKRRSTRESMQVHAETCKRREKHKNETGQRKAEPSS